MIAGSLTPNWPNALAAARRTFFSESLHFSNKSLTCFRNKGIVIINVDNENVVLAPNPNTKASV